MCAQFPPEFWPYGAAYYPGEAEGTEAWRQQPMQQIKQPAQQMQQVPQQAGTASFPFAGQFGVPEGGQTAPPQTLPYPFPSYTIPPGGGQPGVPGAAAPFFEQSYIENILRLNLGKTATLYATFEGNQEWNAMTFTGTVEAAGRDHVIIEDEATTVRYLIPMVFVNYFAFTGPLNYSYPFDVQSQQPQQQGQQPGR